MKNTINFRSGKFAVKLFASVLLLCMLAPISVFPAAANPGSQQKNGSDPIYLPMVFNNYDLSLPVLSSPQNAALLTTLIPHFIFDISYTAAPSYGCLAVDTGSNPTRCEITFSITAGNNNHYDLLLPYNLVANQGYNWRVGVSTSPSDFSQAKWSEIRSFKAGSGGTILPAPTLTYPGNNSTVTIPSPGTINLTWNGVSGAVSYTIQTRDTSISTWSTWTSNTNSYNCVNCFQPNKTYQWTVQARNDFAWGFKSTLFTFHTKP